MRMLLLAGLLGSCCTGPHAERQTFPVAPLPHDPHSYAEPTRVAVKHLSLELTVDFTQKILHGTAKLDLDRREAGAPVRLDTMGLSIDGVTECGGKPLVWALDSVHRVLGQALVIQRPSACVAIAYRTRPDARALLWVERDGTRDKQAPMLFTQSQAILARSWVPLQDTPSVRFTYDATIHVPDKLWAVMSAENPQQPPADGVWRFAMKQPIPAYLMALAVGDLAFRPIGPRTGVYAEPSLVDAAASEFAEVEAMIAATEKLYGPYRWGRYDMLVLPPSFPYGGMENPRLTFLTPTAITGDRSLVSLIAHELAHSWSGNLVTNATWSDFWLNEGFTTYFERRIMEELRGKELADMLWSLGTGELLENFGAKPGPDTRLALEAGIDRDPDDVPSDAAYEKGAWFLRVLEQRFGRAEFDTFLRRRFDRLAFQSSTTVVFEADAKRELFDKHPAAMPFDLFERWIHEPGIPEGTEPVKSVRVQELQTIAQRFVAGTLFDPKAWSTLDWVIFLKALPPTITLERVQALDDAFHVTTRNAEIQMHWLPIAVRADDRAIAPAVERYLLEVGRRRMIRPLYAAMLAKGEPWLTQARETFARAAPLYHPIVRDTFARMLGESVR